MIVEIIEESSLERLKERVNKSLENKRIYDMKFSTSVIKNSIVYTVLVIINNDSVE